jgi:aspartate 1-decarboxylase
MAAGGTGTHSQRLIIFNYFKLRNYHLARFNPRVDSGECVTLDEQNKTEIKRRKEKEREKRGVGGGRKAQGTK